MSNSIGTKQTLLSRTFNRSKDPHGPGFSTTVDSAWPPTNMEKKARLEAQNAKIANLSNDKHYKILGLKPELLKQEQVSPVTL